MRKGKPAPKKQFTKSGHCISKTDGFVENIILLSVLFFWFGGFHFSETYLIGRNISLGKINKLEVGFWEKSTGYGIIDRDFLEPNENWIINNDTLYIDEEPIAEVVSLAHRCFIDSELTIQSFDKQRISSYVSK